MFTFYILIKLFFIVEKFGTSNSIVWIYLLDLIHVELV